MDRASERERERERARAREQVIHGGDLRGRERASGKERVGGVGRVGVRVRRVGQTKRRRIDERKELEVRQALAHLDRNLATDIMADQDAVLHAEVVEHLEADLRQLRDAVVARARDVVAVAVAREVHGRHAVSTAKLYRHQATLRELDGLSPLGRKEGRKEGGADTNAIDAHVWPLGGA